MKSTIKIMAFLFLVVFASCRDTAKEEAAAKETLEKIEAVEQEAEEIQKEINQDADELEDALKELDSI